jgi:flagellar biosynthesis protein FliQ
VVNPYEPPNAPQEEEETEEESLTLWPEIVFAVCIAVIMFFGEVMVSILADLLRGLFS